MKKLILVAEDNELRQRNKGQNGGGNFVDVDGYGRCDNLN